VSVLKQAPGFFGKVSSHGDFVARRLPEPVKNVWDEWLQAGIQASQQLLTDSWLPTYLTSPVWRFALAGGVADEQVWVGVLMPSVDRVGRHFPLVICAVQNGQSNLMEWMSRGKAWYDAIEVLARSSLQADFSLDEFDHALCAMSILVDPMVSDTGLPGHYRWPMDNREQSSLAMLHLSSQIAGKILSGHSLWWTEGSALVAPSVLLCRGWPQAGACAAMLDGAWQDHGWNSLSV